MIIGQTTRTNSAQISWISFKSVETQFCFDALAIATRYYLMADDLLIHHFMWCKSHCKLQMITWCVRKIHSRSYNNASASGIFVSYTLHRIRKAADVPVRATTTFTYWVLSRNQTKDMPTSKQTVVFVRGTFGMIDEGGKKEMFGIGSSNSSSPTLFNAPAPHCLNLPHWWHCSHSLPIVVAAVPNPFVLSLIMC